MHVFYSETKKLASLSGDSFDQSKLSFQWMHLSTRIGTCIMLTASFLSLVYIIDPSDYAWGADSHPFMKYLPIVLSVLAIPFLFRRLSLKHKNRKTLRILFLFAFFVFAGSLYTVLAQKNTLDESFLGRSLCIFTLFPAYFMFSLPHEVRLFSKWFWFPVLACGMFMSIVLIMWSSGNHVVKAPHIFHEEIFIPASASVLAFVVFRKYALKWIIVFLLLAAGIFSAKYTGYIASLISVLIIFTVIWNTFPKSRKIGLMLRRITIIELILGLGVLVTISFLFYRESLPSGSAAVRMFTYAERIEMFLRNPLFGNFFIGTPFMEQAYLYIPSHSDVLDIMAFGGIVGLLLFLGPIIRLIVKGIKDIDLLKQHVKWPYLYSITIVIIFTFEMAVNPVWNQPKLAFFYWLAVGYLLAQH